MPLEREQRLVRLDIQSELDGIMPRRNRQRHVLPAPVYSLITHATFIPRSSKADVVALHSARPSEPKGRVIALKVPFFHTSHGAFFRHERTRQATAPRLRPDASAYHQPYYGTRLVRFDIAAELERIPPKHNSHGIVWTAPRYAWITHAAFRPHTTKPDVVTLYSSRPIEPEGRVLKFKVPFVHTAHGVFYRPREA